MACCTFLPSRGPAARALTASFCVMPNSSGEASAASTSRTDLMFSSSRRIIGVRPQSRRRPVTTTVSGPAAGAPAGSRPCAGESRSEQICADAVHRFRPARRRRGNCTGVGPVGQVHGTAAGEALARSPRSPAAAAARPRGTGLEHGVERVEARSARPRRPEPVAASGGRTSWSARPRSRAARRRRRRVEASSSAVTSRDQVAGLGEDVAVERRRSSRRAETASPRSRRRGRGVGVEREEVPRVPQRQQHLAHALADALLGDDRGCRRAGSGDAIRNQRIASEPSRSNTS